MLHKLTSKGWGYELEIVNNDLYCGKILHFVTGFRCSLHVHKLKHETFYCSSGKILLEYGDAAKYMVGKIDEEVLQEMQWLPINTMYLMPGDSFVVPPYTIHRMTGLLTSELYEFSTHHEDSDSYRIIKGD